MYVFMESMLCYRINIYIIIIKAPQAKILRSSIILELIEGKVGKDIVLKNITEASGICGHSIAI